MVDFSKYTVGDIVAVHCCNSCLYRFGITPKRPADSYNRSWPCKVCGHRGIGSLTDCKIVPWLRLVPIKVSEREHPAFCECYYCYPSKANIFREIPWQAFEVNNEH